MHRGQFRRRQPRHGIALIALHLIGKPKLFQQPQNPLRTGVVEMMEREHARFPWGLLFVGEGLAEVCRTVIAMTSTLPTMRQTPRLVGSIADVSGILVA